MKALLLSLALLTCSSAQDLSRYEFESPQMGTLFKIILYAPDEASATTAANSAFALANKLNNSFSDYDADSELRQLIKQRSSIVSSELLDILRIAKKISKQTDGAFDVTASPHIRNWRRTRITGKLPTKEEIHAAKKRTGWEKILINEKTNTITLSDGMELDLGGIAKGYAADAMLRLLKQQGYPIASIAAGGDIATGDPPPDTQGWQIAIAPNGNKHTQTFTLTNQAISTSGQAEQHLTINGTTYSHIVDPRTGLGLTNSLPVSVIADTATQSDALATAISIIGKANSLTYSKHLNIQIIWPEE